MDISKVVQEIQADQARVRNTSPRHTGSGHHVAQHVRSRAGQKRKTVILVIAIVAALFVAMAAFCFYVRGLDEIYPKITMEGVEVGGMSPYDAARTLEQAGLSSNQDLAVTVELPMDQTLVITAAEAGAVSNAADAAVRAYEYGRDGNLLTNALTYLRCLISGADLTFESEMELEEQAIRARIDEAIQTVNLELMGSDVTVEDTYISVVKGSKAVTIDADAVYALVETAFREGNYGTVEYVPPAVEDDEIDLDALYDSIFKEPKNATYDAETGEIVPHVQGVSFDKEQARALWDSAQNGDEVKIPLILTDPEITTTMLEDMLFRDLLSSKTTYLTYSSNRNNNVTLAAAAINNLVLNPGEEFSYNGTVGQRTTEKGYLGAGAYSGGQVVTEVGGGICQVSSTLYYCTLLANLEITERTCHYFGVSYLPAGLDATVSWPSPDFKFVNNRDYPIKIVAYTDLNALTVTVEIYGTDVDGSYVQMTTETWTTADGYGATSYRNVYDKDGNLISSTQEAKSHYHYHVEESPSPSPSESPSPSPSPSGSPTPDVSPTPGTEVSPTPGESPAPSASTDVVVTGTPAVDPSAPVSPDPVEPTVPVEPTESILPADPAAESAA